MLEKLSPILPTRDINAAAAFWQRIGFVTIFADAEYLLMKRDGAELHFWLKPGLDPATNDAGAYARPTELGALDAECRALGLPLTEIPRYIPAADKPWGMRELAIIDPDGNLIRAGQELPLG